MFVRGNCIDCSKLPFYLPKGFDFLKRINYMLITMLQQGKTNTDGDDE